jgi:hypothetical protein
MRAMDATGTSPCPCFPDDLALAREHLRHMTHEATWLADSHRGVRLQRCGCGQLYLYAFYELVDWAEGDDSQATVAYPLTPDEAARFSPERPPSDADLLALPPRRQLIWSRPRGDTTPGLVQWVDRAIVVFPHD